MALKAVFLLSGLLISQGLALPQVPAQSQAPPLTSALPSTSNQDISCYGNDRGPDQSWVENCGQLVDALRDDPAIPDQLVFGAGGLPVPWTYDGSGVFRTDDCEVRVELSTVPSSQASKTDLFNAIDAVDLSCISRPFYGIQRLGGSVNQVGIDKALKVTLGKTPLLPPTFSSNATIAVS